MNDRGRGRGFFCFRSNFRATTRLETLATQANVPSKHVWKIKESCYVYTTSYLWVFCHYVGLSYNYILFKLKYGQYPDWMTPKPRKGDLREQKSEKNFTGVHAPGPPRNLIRLRRPFRKAVSIYPEIRAAGYDLVKYSGISFFSITGI